MLNLNKKKLKLKPKNMELIVSHKLIPVKKLSLKPKEKLLTIKTKCLSKKKNLKTNNNKQRLRMEKNKETKIEFSF